MGKLLAVDMVSKEKFLQDVSQHTMQLKLCNGMYRHLYFGKPDSGNMAFSLLTAPGVLFYYGDMGSYSFSRMPDMFAFFRSPKDALTINPSYWAEKLLAVDKNSGVTEFSPNKFYSIISAAAADFEANGELEIKRRIYSQLLNGQAHDFTNESAHAAVAELDDGTSLRRPIFQDSWEYDFTDYTYRFIWALWAITWGISKFDEFQSGE